MRLRLAAAIASFCALGAAGTARAEAQTSVAAAPERPAGGSLKDETVGVRPQFGTIAYDDPSGSLTARAAEGVGVDLNVIHWITAHPMNYYLGISTGAIYSHVGSDFLILPADAKLGYHLSPGSRVGIHLGANAIYRALANAIDLGASSRGAGSAWSVFPNAGADIELGLARGVALLIRPDFTFSPVDTVFTGTVGLDISLG